MIHYLLQDHREEEVEVEMVELFKLKFDYLKI